MLRVYFGESFEVESFNKIAEMERFIEQLEGAGVAVHYYMLFHI